METKEELKDRISKEYDGYIADGIAENRQTDGIEEQKRHVLEYIEKNGEYPSVDWFDHYYGSIA